MVGGQDDGQPGGHHGLHVLAAGVDDLFTPHLMRECLGLAVMSVVYTSASSLTKGQVDYLEARLGSSTLLGMVSATLLTCHPTSNESWTSLQPDQLALFLELSTR